MRSQLATPTEAAILARIVQAGEGDLTPDAARYLLSMNLPSSDEDRVNELSATSLPITGFAHLKTQQNGGLH